MMKLNVKYFGLIKDITSVDNEEFEFSEIQKTNHLIELLEQKYSALKKVNYYIAVNHKIANSDFVLKNNDEVALLPPFSGG